MKVVFSKQAGIDMNSVAVRWQPQVNFTISLLATDPFPDIELPGFTPRVQVQVKTVEATRNMTPVVHRIKFVDPESATELEDKKAIGPYRIIYCVDRTMVFVMSVADKNIVDPYSMHYLNGLAKEYKEYKRLNRPKKKIEKHRKGK